MQLRRPAVERTVDERRVGLLQVGRRLHPTVPDDVAEARGVRLEEVVHPFGEGVRRLRRRAPLRQVAVRPQRLAARRGAGRVGRRHLPDEGEGVLARAADGQRRRPHRQPLGVRPEVHRAGPRGALRPPRHRPVERPVHLDRGAVPLEARQVPHQPCRQVVVPDQPAQQRGCVDVGDDGPPRPDGQAPRRPHPTARPPRRAPGRPSRRCGPARRAASARDSSAPASRPAPPCGTGKPTSWPSIARSQPKTPLIGATAGASLCIAFPASSSRPPWPPNSSSPSRCTGRSICRRVRSSSSGPSRAAQADAGPDRRERREERVEQRVAQPLPLLDQAQPGVAVARVLGVERFRGVLRVPVQDVRPLRLRVLQVREDGGRVHPAQPVVLQAQPADDAGPGRQRVEGAVEVVDVAGDDLRGGDGTAHLRRRLQHDRVPAGLGEGVRRDEPVRSGTDDDRVAREQLHALVRARGRGPSHLRRSATTVAPGGDRARPARADRAGQGREKPCCRPLGGSAGNRASRVHRPAPSWCYASKGRSSRSPVRRVPAGPRAGPGRSSRARPVPVRRRRRPHRRRSRPRRAPARHAGRAGRPRSSAGPARGSSGCRGTSSGRRAPTRPAPGAKLAANRRKCATSGL